MLKSHMGKGYTAKIIRRPSGKGSTLKGKKLRAHIHKYTKYKLNPTSLDENKIFSKTKYPMALTPGVMQYSSSLSVLLGTT